MQQTDKVLKKNILLMGELLIVFRKLHNFPQICTLRADRLIVVTNMSTEMRDKGKLLGNMSVDDIIMIN